jgi:ABC-2 type transport system ATP-binding protein
LNHRSRDIPPPTHAPSASPAIEVERLCKRYQNVLAVDDLSFAVPQGATYGLLGGNGAGKTTTLSILLGVLLPTSGSVRVLGADMTRDRYRALPRMNFTSPYVDLPQRLTVWENLDVYARLYGISARRERVHRLAEHFELTELLKRPYGSLSAGQRTRVSLAKALLNEPEVLLMDEPTASLDPASAERIRIYLQDYQARTGATVLLASHNMQEVERLCQEVLILKHGRMVDRGSPETLMDKYGRDNLEQVFIDIAENEVSPA